MVGQTCIATCGKDHSRHGLARRRASTAASRSMAAAWVGVAACAVACSSPPEPSQSAGVVAQRLFEAAFVLAPPGAECKLHPDGITEATAAIPLLVDEDGVARFQAVRARLDDPIHGLILDCIDRTGIATSRAVDLVSDRTFGPRPFDLGRAGPSLRPALAAGAAAQSDADLIGAGYGVRPNAKLNPAGYARWLAAASPPARFLPGRPMNRPPAATALRPTFSAPSSSAIVAQAPNWTGAVMTGATGLSTEPGTPSYAISEAVFNVPSPIPGGDRTSSTGISVWNGLGGFGTTAGLIQGGIQMYTSASAASVILFREYCCGSPVSNNYTATFTPAPGDSIYSQQWYCDAQGNVDIHGGYGCSYLYDYNQNAVFSCVSPTDSICASVPTLAGWPLGNSSEFVIELEVGPAFTDFAPAVHMSGSAGITFGSQVGGVGVWEDIGSDPTVWQLTDFTHDSSTLNVSLAPPDAVDFSVACVPSVSCAGRCGLVSDGCGRTVSCTPCKSCGTPQQCCSQAGGIWNGKRCIYM
jgi:Peptidase A4 family